MAAQYTAMKYLFLSLFLWANLAFGFDSIEVLNPAITIHKSGYFKTDKHLTPAQALNSDFTPLPQKAISFGFDQDTYWFLFEISTATNEQFYLDSRDLLGSYQDFYVYQNNQLIRHDKSGFYVPRDQKSIDTFSSRIKLEKNTKNITYLIKINSTFMRFISFAFGSENDVEKMWASLLVINVAISLTVFSFLIYNTFLYFFTKDKSYLYYILYIIGLYGLNQCTIGYLPFQLGIEGKTSMFFWIFSMIILANGIVFFTISFLNIGSHYKSIKSIFFILLLSNIFFTPFHIFSNIISYSQTIWILSVEALQLFAIFIGVKRYMDGFKPALYYLIATGVGIIFSFFFMLLIQKNYIHYSLLTMNFSNLTLIWDLIMFSIALAYRIKLLREENLKNERLVIMKSRQKVIGELTGNIAHQWRQPLNTIGAILTTTEAKLKYDSISHNELIEVCESSSRILKNLSNTVETMQNFFINQDSEKEPFDLNKQLSNIISFLQEAMKNQRITIEFNPTQVLTIESDQNLLSQVIMNLLSNAKNILNERNKDEEKIIVITTDIQNAKVIITIEDNGKGISTKPIEKIFDPFMSTNASGTGLGLYMSKNITERLGGTLSASNTPLGAKFTIELPNDAA